MSSELTEERAERVRALRELIASPGWALLTRMAANEWGFVGYGMRTRELLASTPPGPERDYAIATKIQQLDATKTAIDEIMSWPDQELQRLAPDPKSRMPFAKLRRAGANV